MNFKPPVSTDGVLESVGGDSMTAPAGGAVSEPVAPAAVAGCARSHPHENMDSACRAKAAIAEMRNKAARGAEATAHDLERFFSMIAAALVEAQQHAQQQKDTKS